MFSRIFFVPSDFVQIKTFSHGQTLTHNNNLSVKRAYFTDKTRLRGLLNNLSPAAVTYQ